MIGYLHGLVLEKTPDALIVDVNGVGYEVVVPMSSLCALPPAGNHASLYIHTHVREDAIRLFGFVSYFDRKVFESLITVSSVGPKLAVTLLGPLSGVELCETILSGRIAVLCSIPGVGAKTAERLLLELKPKFAKLMALRNDLISNSGDLVADSAAKTFHSKPEQYAERTSEQQKLFAEPDEFGSAVALSTSKISAGAKRAQQQIEKKMAARRTLDDLSSALQNVGYKEKQISVVLREYEEMAQQGQEIVLERALRSALLKLSGHLIKDAEAER